MFTKQELEILSKNKFKNEDNQFFFEDGNLSLVIDVVDNKFILTVENPFHPLVSYYDNSKDLLIDVQGFIFSHYGKNQPYLYSN